MKCTRNALLRCKIQFKDNKVAKFEHIKTLFEIHQTKNFKMLYKLKSHFNFKDTFVKMRVKIAAARLNHTVAAGIEIYSISGLLPCESLQTVEFV